MEDEFKKILADTDRLRGIDKDTLDILKGISSPVEELLKGIRSPAEELLKSLRSPAEDLLNDLRAQEETMDKLLGDRQMRELRIPDFKMPTQEEVNEYQSASVLMEKLANEALEWKNTLREGLAPAIFAILYGGIQIQVQSLSQVSFHGIRIEGILQGNPCVMFAHQSTVQMLCLATEVKADEPRRPIGFIWPDNKVEV